MKANRSRHVVSMGIVCLALSSLAQAQMDTPAPTVPPSAQPVPRPTRPNVRAPVAPALSTLGRPTPDVSPDGGTASTAQTPTGIGPAQINIPLGRPKTDVDRPAAAPPSGTPAPRKAPARPAKPGADCSKIKSASERGACDDTPRPATP